jgi:hypothetical protein
MRAPPSSGLKDWRRQSEGGEWAVFENSMGTKNSEASESVAFYKIQKNSAKFGKIRPKCI